MPIHDDERTLLDGAGRTARSRRSDGSSDHPVLDLQRAAGNAAVTAMLEIEEREERSPVLDVVGRGGGRPLDDEVRADMEGNLGADFSDVRVHTDQQAAESAKAVSASAYTVGNDVVFGADGYNPSSTDGRKTLAHELTHVVQQRSGPVDGTPSGGGISVSDPSDRFEQEASATADRVAARSTEASSDAVATGAPAVQRQAAEEEELPEEEPPVQGQFVQRDEAEEEKLPEEE